jgi:hypothetical protein
MFSFSPFPVVIVPLFSTKQKLNIAKSGTKGQGTGTKHLNPLL